MVVPLRSRLPILCALLFGLGAGFSAAPAGAAPRLIYAPVLVYHHIKWLKPSDDAIERGLTILPTQFAAQLNVLERDRYHPITAAYLIHDLRAGRRLPSRPVVLTFDDGYTDVYRDVYKVLLRRHLRATFFIVPGFLDQPRYLTWAQVEDMAKHGMDIEAHTMTHPDLTTLSAASVRYQLDVSRQILQRRIHHPVRILAYPYGAYNAGVLRAVARAGFWAAFTTFQSPWLNTRSLLQLSRVYPNHSDTLPLPAADPRLPAGESNRDR